MTTIEICKALTQEAFTSPERWKANCARAKALLETALEKEPSNTLLITCLGTVLCDIGEHEYAVKVLKRAVELQSCDRNTYFNLGVATLNCGSHEEAMQCFSKARSLQSLPQSWEAYFDPQAH